MFFVCVLCPKSVSICIAVSARFHLFPSPPTVAAWLLSRVACRVVEVARQAKELKAQEQREVGPPV